MEPNNPQDQNTRVVHTQDIHSFVLSRHGSFQLKLRQKIIRKDNAELLSETIEGSVYEYERSSIIRRVLLVVIGLLVITLAGILFFSYGA